MENLESDPRLRVAQSIDTPAFGFSVRPLVLVLGGILALTAVPLGFRTPSLEFLYTRWNPGDIAGNILLYIPLGLVSTRSFSRTFLLALGVSVCAEVEQFIAPTRFPGVADVVSNVLGACIGSFVAVGVRRVGWNPSLFRVPKRATWIALLAGGLCSLALFPRPVSGDFSNWDPACRLAFGDEVTGDRRWRGEILDAEIIPSTLGPSLIQALAAEGPGSASRHRQEFPEPPVFELHSIVNTVKSPVFLPPSESAELFNQATRRNQLSILLWARTADQRQRGARMITYSCDAQHSNFIVSQQRGDIVFRLRTPAIAPNGTGPETETPPLLKTERDTFVAAIYDGRYARIYVDGRLSAEADLRKKRVLGPVPSLGLAYCAGALFAMALITFGLFRVRRWGASAVAFAFVSVLILSMPQKVDSGLTWWLLVALLLGVIAAKMAIQPES
jgi:hypothetical protein